MLRTLFGKLFLIISLTLVVTFVVTGVALSVYLQQTLTDSKVSELKLATEDISKIFNDYLDQRANPIFIKIMQSNLDRMQQNTGALIFISDTNGKILFSAPQNLTYLNDKLKFDGKNYSLSDPQQTAEVIKTGEYSQMSGDFFGLFKNVSQDMLTIAKLEHVTAEGITNAKFIVYTFVKMPEIFAARQNAINTYIAWGTIAILGVLLSLYFITKRVTKPIKEMNVATKKMAKGEMGQRVSENSKDEVGELAKSFNAMAKALENLENMRRDFIANVSHELRTPMTSMRGFIDAMLDGTIEEDKRSYYLQIVREETSRLSRLVDDLLDLSRMQSGKLSAELTVLDINELTRKSIIKLEQLLVQKNINFETSFDENPSLVLGDSDLLERVLINLLSNAIKFTPEGGRIAVSTEVTASKVIVRVSDNGPGMTEDQIGQVFERFYKADKSRDSKYLGTGLGLSIAREIIRLHGGEISANSEVGKGSVFEFWLNKQIV